MTRTHGLTLSASVAAGVLLCGHLVSAQHTTSWETPGARTHWGEPDLRGTYARVFGARPTPCGSNDLYTMMMSPIYAGLTKIEQSPGVVRIRNQFSGPRVVIVSSGARVGRAPQATWDGETLVVETGALGERFTRLDADTLDYTYTARTATEERPWTLSFPLTRRPVTHDSALRDRRPCGPAAVD
jgi:hypothetical protein